MYVELVVLPESQLLCVSVLIFANLLHILKFEIYLLDNNANKIFLVVQYITRITDKNCLEIYYMTTLIDRFGLAFGDCF